jgi:hypothetical protein
MRSLNDIAQEIIKAAPRLEPLVEEWFAVKSASDAALQEELDRLTQTATALESRLREREATIGRCLERGIKLRDVVTYMHDHEQSREEVVEMTETARETFDREGGEM